MSEIPVTDQFKKSLSSFRSEDPFMIAKALKDSNKSLFNVQPMVSQSLKFKLAANSTNRNLRGIR